MRKLLYLTIILFATLQLNGQFQVFGNVTDEEGEPYVGLGVEIYETEDQTVTDEDGFFLFESVDTGEYAIIFDHPYGQVYKVLYVEGEDVEFNISIRRRVQFDEVTISATRLTGNEPFNNEMIDEDYIDKEYDGQDVPYLFKNLRSMVVNSDAGNGFGYTGIRIRGLDPGHVNVSINGIPLNDSESQLVFWVDLPDILSSTKDIQIQRGLGASGFGSGQFGASMNFNTNQIHLDPYIDAALGGGSFGTYRGSVSLGTGLMNNKFSVDGRVSYAHSDGYIDRASSDLRSFFISAAMLGLNSSVRFNVINGHEVTYQAWNGVPVNYIDDATLRTFNSAGQEKVKMSGDSPYEDEVDNYTQTHYQLFYNKVVNKNQFSLTGFYTRGKGFFENYRADEQVLGYDLIAIDPGTQDTLEVDDLVVRRWLDNHYYGVNAGLTRSSKVSEFKVGALISRYDGGHFGEVIESGVLGEFLNPLEYYNNQSTKHEATAFVKYNHQFGDLSLYGDVQYRFINYEYGIGDGDDGELRSGEEDFNFINPKMGLSYALAEDWRLFASAAMGNREPNRDDFLEAAEGQTPNAEKMINSEFGIEMNKKRFKLGLYGYHMKYEDQLVLTGRINDVGEYARINVEDSYRLGIEVDGTAQVTRSIQTSFNAAFSQNKINDFVEYIDDWDTGAQVTVDHGETDISFSPSVVAFFGIDYTWHEPFSMSESKIKFSLDHKYIGEQFLDNTSNEASKLDEILYGDLTVSFEWPVRWTRHFEVRARVNNIWDSLYETNGWIYRFRSSDPGVIANDPYGRAEGNETYNLTGLFPQAGRHFLVTLLAKF